MISLILKELRENFKWALLAMLVLGGAEIYIVYPQNQQEALYGSTIGGITICKTSFLTVTTFGCAITGFLLGLIQILPELKRDRWASLLHRPVSRGVVFRDKAVAGIILYCMATVPPFLATIWLINMPGQVASPFVPEMVFPGTVDICAGMTYYFAGLALALQRGGWMILRAFPLLAAIHTSYSIYWDKFFYIAVNETVLMALALFTAAWGEIHNQDVFRTRPLLGKIAFLAVVFYGAVGLGDLGRSLLKATVPNPYSNFERYDLTREGVPLHFFYGKGGVIVSVQNLDGTPTTNPDYRPDRVRNHIMYTNTFSEDIGDSHGHHPWRYEPGYRDTREYMWADNPTGSTRLEQWFNLIKQNYLVGYAVQKKIPFSILDRKGFEPMSAVPEGFTSGTQVSYAGSGVYCLWDPNHARYAYLDRREIVDLPRPLPGPTYGSGYAWGVTKRGSTSVLGLVYGTGLALYNDDAAVITSLPYHQNVDRWGTLSLGVSGDLDRFYLRYDPSGWIAPAVRKTMSSYVEEMDRQGNVLHSYTLAPLPDHPNPRTWEAFLAQRIQSPAFFFGTMLYKQIGAALGNGRMKYDLDGQFVRDRALTNEVTLYMCVISLFLAGVTLFLTKRACFSTRRACAWTAFVLAFNIPGFITFRLVADWPRFVSCPTCAKGRPVDFEKCPHCGAGWPKPPVTGIEIFDRPEAGVLSGTSV